MDDEPKGFNMSLNNWIVYEHRDGSPIQSGSLTLTPISRALVVQFPGLRGGLVWSRPSALRVSQPGVADRLVPVRDVTRLTVLGIMALAAVGAVLARILIRKDS